MSNAILEYKTQTISMGSDKDKKLNEMGNQGWMLCDVFGPTHYFYREKDDSIISDSES